ncbi:MAG: DUF2339 domain-containing protein [Sedimentisphaerales bacterium]|jgi:uncharacterized membrane protein
MDEQITRLAILLAIVIAVSGPVALIISIVALNKIKGLRDLLDRKDALPWRTPEIQIPTSPTKPEKLAEVIKEQPVFKPASVPMAAKPISFADTADTKQAGSLEQKIGTRWLLILGIITSIVGVGFFLKYAYDNAMVGPLGRVVITAAAGIVALIVGEGTRRRGYGIVAKGVTSLGFAILYAAVFSAYLFYELIGSGPTFALAIFITATAMFYAVSLDEVIIAFFSLLGGFLTPVLVSTGENRPMALFGYVLVLGVGAILCAFYRKWRAIIVLSFAGTYLLYAGWFEKFYRHTANGTDTPAQISTALGWLTVFFAVYLIMPVLYALVKKINAQKEDVILVLANAGATFYYLWNILFYKFRVELAFCAVGLCVAHLALMTVATKRYKDDIALRLSLLVIGLFFLTIAVPLYLKMYAVAIAWAAEGVVLTIIGLRYKSIWTQLAGVIALLLSMVQLVLQLPMHKAAFQAIFNPAFGSWCFLAAAILVCHIIYRKSSQLEKYSEVPQFFYGAACLLFFATVTMEWYWHCMFNFTATPILQESLFIKGVILVLSAFIVLLTLRPVCPKGTPLRSLAAAFAVGAAIFTMILFNQIYDKHFLIFANVEFATAMVLVAILLASAVLIEQRIEEDENAITFAIIFALAGIFTLWVLISEEIYFYWYCLDRYGTATPNWQFLANMYTSIAWAVYGIALMIAGFWRHIKTLRFAALGLFAILLVKVFIMDMSTVKSVYRIAAFLATGVTLLAVSYLYQYLKNRGFFDTLYASQKQNEISGDSK